MGNLDQKAIDELVASIDDETLEDRLKKLEDEINALKGSIKRLLMDIRETLNNLENPFQSLQNLAKVVNKPLQPQLVQVVPSPSLKSESKVREDKEEKEKEVKRENKESINETLYEKKEQEELMKKVEDLMEFEKIKSDIETFEKLDIVTLCNLIGWIKNMLKKFDSATLKEIIDVFMSAGYISPKFKEFIVKIIDIVDVVGVNSSLEDLILDLYKLYKITNPNDTSMDSKLLSLILEKKLR